jgi:hypothetical protein
MIDNKVFLIVHTIPQTVFSIQRVSIPPFMYLLTCSKYTYVLYMDAGNKHKKEVVYRCECIQYVVAVYNIFSGFIRNLESCSLFIYRNPP